MELATLVRRVQKGYDPMQIGARLDDRETACFALAAGYWPVTVPATKPSRMVIDIVRRYCRQIRVRDAK
jgi:hypothetical protein